MLKNRNNFPPGGFTFHQPQTGWSAPGWLSFDATVNAIIQHRQANPRHGLETAKNVVEWELEKYTVERLKSMPGGDQYLVLSAPASSFPKPLHQSIKEVVVAGANKVTKLKAGIGLIIEWLGSSARPVEKELAESRASVCVGCPENHSSDITTIFTKPASNKIMQQLEAKHEMSLSTSMDDKLGVCNVCLCPMKLKIWTPTSFLKESTSAKVKSELPEICWVKREISA